MKQKVCVIGDGLTGLAAALILGHLNVDVDLIAPAIKRKTTDIRTTAISKSNFRYLINLIGKQHVNYFWPSRKINLYYQDSSDHKQFMNFEDQQESLMYIIPNNKLKSLIKNKIQKKKNINIIRNKIEKINYDKTEIILKKKRYNYQMILVCTGKESSLTKNLVGRRFIYKDLNEFAFTTIVSHNDNISNAKQFFLKEGPMAILPINKKRFSLVWSLDKNFFKNNIKTTLKEKLKHLLNLKGNFKLSKIDFFRISFKFNINSIKKNTLVLGEGSYNVHPVAGQGFNLILRDLITLDNEIKNNLSMGIQLKDSLVLNNFIKKRKPENLFFGLGINFINNFFRHNKVNRTIKSLILKDINNFTFLKKLSLNLSNRGLF